MFTFDIKDASVDLPMIDSSDNHLSDLDLEHVIGGMTYHNGNLLSFILVNGDETP